MNSNRPLYISCVFWGEEFRNFYADYFLSTLIASKNLPSIKGLRACKLLVATTREDFLVIQDLPITKEVEKYAELVLLEIPPCPPGVHGCNHMGVGHILATEMAFRDRAYLCALVPDMLMSNGTINFINQKIEDGHSSVLCTCMRVEDKGFLADVRKFGKINKNEIIRNSNKSLEITGSELVQATMSNLHSQSLSWEFGKSYFSTFPVAPFWTLEKNQAWVIHSLHWVPLMLDYGVVENHDKTCLENWTMDGDYLHDNFGSTNKSAYIVVDSDEAIVTSWSPKEDRAVSIYNSYSWVEKLPDCLKPIKDYVKHQHVTKGIESLEKTYNNQIFDKTKRDFFSIPIIWHVNGNKAIYKNKINDFYNLIIEIIKSEPNKDYEILSKNFLKINNEYHNGIEKKIVFYHWLIKNLLDLLFKIFDFIFIINKIVNKLKIIYYLYHGRFIQSKQLIKKGQYRILTNKIKIALKKDKHYLLRYKIFWYINKFLKFLKDFLKNINAGK